MADKGLSSLDLVMAVRGRFGAVGCPSLGR